MKERVQRKPKVKTTAITETRKPAAFVEVLITKADSKMAYSVGHKYQVTSSEAKKLKDLGIIE
jgi:hypothetical protein